MPRGAVPIRRVLLVLPIAVHAARYGDGGISWVEPTTFHGLLNVGYHVAGSHFLLAVLAAALLVNAVMAWRHRDAEDGRAAQLTLLGVIAPVGIAIVVSAVVTPVVVDRYFIECVPFAAIAIALAVCRLPTLPLRLVAIAALVCFSLASVVNWYERSALQDWRAATRYLVTTGPAGGQILNAMPGQGLRYYLGRDSATRLQKLDSLTDGCEDQAPPSCIGSADQVIFITGAGSDLLAVADQRALTHAGYVPGQTRSFAGPISITYYERVAH